MREDIDNRVQKYHIAFWRGGKFGEGFVIG
jgi:hypothetical protein